MKISVLGTRGFPKIQGGVEKHCESLYPLFNAKYQITVYRRKPYVNSDKTYPNIKFIDLPSTKIKGFEAVFHSFLATLSACFGKSDVVHIHNIGLNPEKPDVPLNKNDAFQKVQKRRVQEKR